MDTRTNPKLRNTKCKIANNVDIWIYERISTEICWFSADIDRVSAEFPPQSFFIFDRILVVWACPLLSGSNKLSFHQFVFAILSRKMPDTSTKTTQKYYKNHQNNEKAKTILKKTYVQSLFFSTMLVVWFVVFSCFCCFCCFFVFCCFCSTIFLLSWIGKFQMSLI